MLMSALNLANQASFCRLKNYRRLCNINFNDNQIIISLTKEQYGLQKRYKIHHVNKWDCRPLSRRIIDPNKVRNNYLPLKKARLLLLIIQFRRQNTSRKEKSNTSKISPNKIWVFIMFFCKFWMMNHLHKKAILMK